MSIISTNTPKDYFFYHQKMAAWYAKEGERPMRALRMYTPLRLEDMEGKPIQIEAGSALISDHMGNVRILSPEEFKGYDRAYDLRSLRISQHLPLEEQLHRLYELRKEGRLGWSMHLIDINEQIKSLPQDQSYSVGVKATFIRTKALHGQNEIEEFAAALREQRYYISFRTDLSEAEKEKCSPKSANGLEGLAEAARELFMKHYGEYKKKQKMTLTPKTFQDSTHPAPPFKIQILDYGKSTPGQNPTTQ